MSHKTIDTNCGNWPPKVWAILCYRAGDNSQIIALAEALGWPFEIKRLVYRKFGYGLDVLRGSTTAGIVRHKSDPLNPPWPDLLISAAMRNEPVCRWIQKQTGGMTRYVHIGRPWARLANFDLVVTVPEYRSPVRPNVLHNKLSLHRVTEHRLAEAAATWAPRLAHLPKPYIAVLIGGYSGPYAFDHEKATHLGHKASAMASETGGSLLVTTSARTPCSPADSLAAAISVPTHFFRWTPNTAVNPYYAYLALADAIIVTSDSTAMLAEACATRKSVYIFDLSGDSCAAQPMPSWLGSARHWRWQDWRIDHLKAFLYRQMMRIPPRRLTRDVRLVHQSLIASGRAIWLGQRFPPGPPPPPLGDTQRTVERIRTLFIDNIPAH
jgi:mitochondrial fission protein ELM1